MKSKLLGYLGVGVINQMITLSKYLTYEKWVIWVLVILITLTKSHH